MPTHYLLRSRQDGKYVVAKPDNERTYLLVFREDAEARTYLNAHASDLRDRVGIEAVPNSAQLKHLIQRWGYEGIALVSDPLLSQLQFLDIETGT